MRPYMSVRHCVLEVCPYDLGGEVSDLVGVISDGSGDPDHLLSFGESFAVIPDVTQAALGTRHSCRQVKVEEYGHE